MATEISSDLINQLNLSLRKNANLSSFDSSSLSLPTAPEAIAELDASPPYLRCRNCEGKLLRGIESLICVFCGQQQRTSDNAPDPIKLTSTFAYQWFLTSLDLDGSIETLWNGLHLQEMVEAIKETSGSSRGAKAPVVKGVALSEFLDFEVKWCSRDEKTDGLSVHNKSPLNLGGISLDDYSVEERGDLSKVESKPEDDDFKDPRSLSLFDSVKSQGVVESQQNDNVGLVMGNDAKKNESLSLFAGRDGQDSVSLAEQGNFGFFEGKESEHSSFKEDENLSLFDGKDAPRTSSSRKDDSFGFFEGRDAQRTSSSKEDESFGFFEGKDTQRNSASKEDGNLGFFEGKDGQRNSSSKEDESFGLFEGAPSSDDKVVASSSDWDSDFQSVSQEKMSGDPFVSSPVDLSAHMDSVFGAGKTADSATAYVSKGGDWLQDDLFGNVSGKFQNNDKNEGQVVGRNGSSSMDIDWMGDDLWQTSEKKAIEKTPTDDNDDDDDWNDFASSANSKTPSNLLSTTMESSQEEIFDGLSHVKNDVKEQSEYEKQNTDASVISDIAKGQEGDLFGAWDSFASSTVLQTPVQPPTNHVNPSAEQDQGMNLFGESNSEEVKAMPSKTSTSERTGDPDGQDQVTTVSRKSKSEVAEELMSQMHDLSFMLETKLSVPPISKAE
ncbi:hypothetical protein F2Q68_00038332 [Brassica cretica]|uniref:DUF7815 domain-containing protein n=1 Tax=Brassica cretica TaxID=69181 RepID=A0A8S9MIV5_BRACR|nr:hypothetical protein F2Q68_00038332 [Brassica cretica]